MRSKRLISSILVFLMFFSMFFGMNGADAVEAGSSGGKYVINIIWDGLSADLFNKLKEEGLETPNIDELINNGTILDNVETAIPSYGGAQAAAVTGAYPETNGFIYRYYDKTDNVVKLNVYNFNAETIFESINSQAPDTKTLALGINVAGKTLNGRGVNIGDPVHTLIEYANGDKLVSFGTAGTDLLNSINSAPDGMADYIMAYSNDIKMYYWGGNRSDAEATEEVVKEIMAGLDSKLGEVINALKEKGIYDDTVIILNSLSGMYSVPSKITTLANEITTGTGVKTELSGGAVAADTKAVIVKTYIMKYAQLSFTNNATEEDKAKVLAYLEDKTTAGGKRIDGIFTPADFSAPAIFADYLLDPVDSATFSAAGIGVGRTDNLDDMNQFCIVSGKGVIRNASVGSANIADIVPTVSYILGMNSPADSEGNMWDIFDFTSPELNVQLDGGKDENGDYNEIVTVTIDAYDDLGLESVRYDIGEGYVDYNGPFEINMDCTLKVAAEDKAGNTTLFEEAVNFVKILDEVTFEGDTDVVGGETITDSENLILVGSLLSDNSSIIVKVNGEAVEVSSMSFQKAIGLEDGKNEIVIEAALGGITNRIKKTVYKVYDPKVTSVEDGAVLPEPLLEVSGTVVPGSEVAVNGQTAVVDQEGNFTASINLAEGENSINITASLGKYIKEANITVGYYTPAQIEITNLVNKQIVKSDMITVEGKVDKSCIVKVNGIEAALEEDYSFSTQLKLVKGVNIITVEADNHGALSTIMLKVVYVDPEDKYVVYINWDGFARYYYDLANEEDTSRTPVINELIGDGVFFDNIYSGIPAITNAMQPAIVSGAWPETTGNAYRYYNKESNVVIQFTRENDAETIAEAAVRQGLKVASVHQFALEDRGTTAGDPDKPYITSDGIMDYSDRFDAAIKMIKGESVGEGYNEVELDEVPRFIALYMDDLDALGHNEHEVYGIPPASTEAERLENVLTRVEEMDEKLGEFIQACKDRGIYDNMSFVLTTDHGMAPFGQQGTEPDEYGMSKLPDFISTLQDLGYTVEVLFEGESPAPETDIVIVCVGLEAQISFTKDYTEEDIDKIVEAAEGKEYVGEIMKKDEMIERGTIEGFADLIVSPKAPYSFKTNFDKLYIARGQHDSLDKLAQQCFSIMWGKGIKNGYEEHGRTYIIDFANTMAELLEINGPRDATGKTLDRVLDDEGPVISIPGVRDGEILNKPVISIKVDDGSIDTILLNGVIYEDSEIELTEPGDYTLYVMASDEAGNVSEKTVRFTVEAK